jgi:hypothetical protein
VTPGAGQSVATTRVVGDTAGVDPYTDVIAGALRTLHVQTPLERVVMFEENDDTAEVAERLAALGFDFAPVTKSGDLSGIRPPGRPGRSQRPAVGTAAAVADGVLPRGR